MLLSPGEFLFTQASEAQNIIQTRTNNEHTNRHRRMRGHPMNMDRIQHEDVPSETFRDTFKKKNHKT